MKIEKTFTIRAPATAVWTFLTDPHRVARALPGAAITGQIDPATYAGTITVKVGPIATSYRGKMHFERLDAPSGTAQIVASGQDVRGKGGAQMRMTSHVSEGTPGQTEVSVESDVAITGLLAQMGRGMIEDVSNQNVRAVQRGDAGRARVSADCRRGRRPRPGRDRRGDDQRRRDTNAG